MNCIFVVNQAGCLRDNARASMVAAAKRWECELWIIEHSPNVLHPACWKTDALDYAAREGFKRVLVLDADAVISSEAWNPFNLSEQLMGVVSDRQTVNPARDDVEMDESKIVTGERIFHERFFNSGVILASVFFHTELFQRAAELCRKFPHLSWHDQTPFNVAAREHPQRVLYIDEAFNFHNPSWRIPDWQKMKKFIYHFPGNPERNNQIDEVIWQ